MKGSLGEKKRPTMKTTQLALASCRSAAFSAFAAAQPSVEVAPLKAKARHELPRFPQSQGEVLWSDDFNP